MSDRPVKCMRPRSERVSLRGRTASCVTATLLLALAQAALPLPPSRSGPAVAQGAQNVPSHLGINIAEPTPGVAGVMVLGVVPGSGAEAVGITLGDRVISAEGRPISSSTDLVCQVQSRPPGATITLTIRRGAETLILSPRLGTWPDDLEPPRLRDCEAMH